LSVLSVPFAALNAADPALTTGEISQTKPQTSPSILTLDDSMPDSQDRCDSKTEGWRWAPDAHVVGPFQQEQLVMVDPGPFPELRSKRKIFPVANA
jgi:hypothetical protein